ncbi:hypothetical protein V6N13_064574 [Hibiscus sabdariffa]|uniref:RING-type E3 ubiquitin transferase n=1 Tax=Hibiscus sabdariffa TaxID=183260 RepID=A0ABR2EAG9_9ROSI
MSSATVNMHRRLLETEVSLPLTNGNKTHDSYISETTFDTNMVFILAALLCALICALGLNSIVRCALRCSRRFAMETPEQGAARLATTGLKKRDLKQIPVAVYGEGLSFGSSDCPICLGEFVDGEKVRVLPKCNHGFHVRCIDTWLLSHSSCPNCRHSLLQLNASKTQAVGSVRQLGNGLGDDENGSVAVAVAVVVE